MKEKTPKLEGTPEKLAAGGAAEAIGHVNPVIAADPDPSVVSIVRQGPFIPPERIVAAPVNYLAIPPDVKHALLKIADDEVSEARDALDECAGKGALLQEDLGKRTPPAEQAAALRDEMEGAHSARVKSEKIATYNADKEAVLFHDIRTFLGRVERNLMHEAEDNPAVLDQYPKVVKYMRQRADAISSGMARARAAKQDQSEKPADGSDKKK